jgi:cytochrome b subunit of formate dehydrogenase
MVISFFGLTLTGLPLLYSDQNWAQALAAFFGGAHACGLLHRLCAILLIANFAVHVGVVVDRVRKFGVRKVLLGPNSMLPRWKDVTDFIGMVKWFFGAKKKPAFDHWTYWEKFDYWAEIFGTFVIGGTGLILWFPTFFAEYLPGWMFNIAMIVHGYEALLAIVFIFTIHFFNANLRWEKFPVDDVIFTGAVPEDELKHERGEEYERLAAAGELAAMRAEPPPAWVRRVGVIAGICAMLVGIAMAALIVLAGLELL